MSMKDKYVWMFRNEIIALELKDIYYFDSYQRKTFVHTKDRVYQISSTLKEEEKRFRDQMFIRVHQGYLINPGRVEAMKRKELVMQNGDLLPISEGNRKTVSVHLMAYFFRRENSKKTG